jgi:hypothetical protein
MFASCTFIGLLLHLSLSTLKDECCAHYGKCFVFDSKDSACFMLGINCQKGQTKLNSGFDMILCRRLIGSGT